MRHGAAFFIGARMLIEDVGNAHRSIPDPPPNSPAPTSSSPLGFPLGTALILFIVFGVSTLFSCCYHWEKITSRFSAHGRPTQAATVDAQTPATSNGQLEKSTCSKQSLSLPVMMPGDEIPKYVAWPSPHGFVDGPEEGSASQIISPSTKATE